MDSEGDLVNLDDPKLAPFVIQAYDPTAENVDSTDSEGEDRLMTEGTSDDSLTWDGFSEVSTTEHFSLEDVVSEDEFDADAAPSLEVGEADEETYPMMAAINALLMDQLPNAGGDGNVTAETRRGPNPTAPKCRPCDAFRSGEGRPRHHPTPDEIRAEIAAATAEMHEISVSETRDVAHREAVLPLNGAEA